MKFKTTVILVAVFAALLVFVLLFESKSKGKKEEEKKLVDLSSADVEKMSLKKEDETIAFSKDEKGDWLITEPLEAKADTYEVNRLAEDFSGLKFERLAEAEAADQAKYEIPKKELTLWYKNRPEPVKLLFGMENPIDNTIFSKKEGDPRIVLLATNLKTQLEKKVFDFRQKDIFKFEPEDVAGLKLRAKDIAWEVRKKDDGWFFQAPLAALAKKSRVEDILRALSGMRAKEFVAETKTDEEIAKFGLKDAEYSVSLSLPSKDQEATFFLHKEDDKVYVTTSLSPKIILAEGQVITDIEKNVEDIREKAVLVFNSWEADKVRVKRGDLVLTVVKNAEDKWLFEDGGKEADSSKLETFIRKIEGLEAAEFVDAPANLQEYGLAPPQVEVTVWTKSGEKETEFQVLFGTEDQEKKQVVAKNPKLEYLFRVDSSVLGDFPKEVKDWTPAPLEDKSDEKKEEKKGDDQ